MRQKRAEHPKRRCTNTRWDDRARRFRSFRPHLLPGVAVSWPIGSIDRPQRGVLAEVVLTYIRIDPVEDLATRVALLRRW